MESTLQASIDVPESPFELDTSNPFAALASPSPVKMAFAGASPAKMASAAPQPVEHVAIDMASLLTWP